MWTHGLRLVFSTSIIGKCSSTGYMDECCFLSVILSLFHTFQKSINQVGVIRITSFDSDVVFDNSFRE